MTDSQPIRIVAALIDDGKGRALLVRKRGTAVFMQPGGKLEPGEDPLTALARELHEELGVSIQADSHRWLGAFEDDAVNEPGRRVQAEVFAVTIVGQPRAQAEIAELQWLSATPPWPVQVAPLSTVHILPLLAKGR